MQVEPITDMKDEQALKRIGRRVQQDSDTNWTGTQLHGLTGMTGQVPVQMLLLFEGFDTQRARIHPQVCGQEHIERDESEQRNVIDSKCSGDRLSGKAVNNPRSQ